MNNIFWKIIAFISTILALLLLMIGLYTFVPSFKTGLDGLIHGKGWVTEDKETEGTESDPDDPSVSQVSVPDTIMTDPVTPDTFLSPELNMGYIPPSEETLEVPDDLRIRSGGDDPIDAALETLSEERADQLEDELDYGQTGDDLSFDPLMYPYYQMLDDKSKHLYRQIYANALALIDDFKAVETSVTGQQLNNAFMAVFNDHPELFYMDTKFSAGFRNNGTCLEIREYFNSLADDIDSTRDRFESAADTVRNASDGSAYDIEKAAHDALADMNYYSLGSAHNQSAYSALVNGSTVCAGYSRAFQYVCQLAGIPCYYCSGYAGENHAWNIICLDDEFYNVDVTWDDTDPGYNYKWFNKTDSDYGNTHIRKNLSVYLPPCNGTKYGNLEPEEEDVEEEDRKSLSDYGLSEDDVIHDIWTYYDKCADMVAAIGGSDGSFDLAVNDPALCAQIADAFNNGTIEDNLLGPVLQRIGGRAIDMNVYPELIENDRYVLRHKYHVY